MLNTNRILAVFLTIIISICLCTPSASAAETITNEANSKSKFLAKIEPPVAGSIPISNRAQLEAVRNNLGGKYHLTADIDLSGTNWVSIGNTRGYYFDFNKNKGVWPNAFTGTFDGQGYVIRNLSYKGINTGGLFGSADGATIKNVGLENTNIYVSFDINSTYDIGANIGGICGLINDGSIINCYNSGRVAGDEEEDSDIGGIVGEGGSSKILYSYNTGTVTGSNRMGGIIGALFIGEIKYCYNNGKVVYANSDNIGAKVGGIVGFAELGVDISDCFNTGLISVASDGIFANVGGITASATHTRGFTIKNCYNVGTVKAGNPSNAAGLGLYGTVINSYCKNLYGSDDGIQLTNEQMRSKESFVGWDFKNIWDISPSENNGFPFLRIR